MTLDRKKLGQDIRDHRKACGKTIEKVVAEIGDDRISNRTLGFTSGRNNRSHCIR